MLRGLGDLRGISWRAFLVWRRDLLALRAAWGANLLPPLLEPTLCLLAFGAVLGGLVGEVADQGARVDYLGFVAPGLAAAAVMSRAFHETLHGSFARMRHEGTFESALATPLSLGDVVAGEILWGTTKSLVSAGAMLGAISVFGAGRWPSSWWVLPLAALGGFLFASLGMCFAAACRTYDALGLPIFLLVLPMFLFSGTFFPLERLPEWAARAALALPLTHLVSLMRAATLGRVPPHPVASFCFLGGVTLVLFVAALGLVRRRLVR